MSTGPIAFDPYAVLQVLPSAEPEVVATDCPLAALRIVERTGKDAVHPVVLLHRAYGMGDAK